VGRGLGTTRAENERARVAREVARAVIEVGRDVTEVTADASERTRAASERVRDVTDVIPGSGPRHAFRSRRRPTSARCESEPVRAFRIACASSYDGNWAYYAVDVH
jgi:hypothetical protein